MFRIRIQLLLPLAFLLGPTSFAHDDAETEKGNLNTGGGGTGGPFSASNIQFHSQLTLSQMGAGGGVRGNDIWGWTDSLDDKEYALVGRSDGTSFVDITDPVNPVYLGFLASHTGNTAWRDVKVYADHAYIVSDNNGNHGMQVFDLTQLRSVASPPATFTETAHYSGFQEAHNIAINELTGFAYVSGTETFSGGLHFVDITNPIAPVAAGGFSADGYTHDNQVVSYTGLDTAYSGREISFNSNEDTLTIVDVTDKNAPVQLSKTGYAGSAYVHQGWLTEDQRYFLSNDELDERNNPTIDFTRTHIWDVADLDAPIYMGFYEAPVSSIDHNLYTHNGYVYEANYTTGLRVLDLADIANSNLTEVASIDTHPSKDSITAFDGAWSVYPYFPSGSIVIGDRDEGLIIVSLMQDVAVSGTDLPDPAVPGFDISYSIDVTNNGPGDAANTTLTDVLPAGVNFVSATTTAGSCNEVSGAVTCDMGTLANGATENVAIKIVALSTGSVANSASVSADGADADFLNNSVAFTTTVLPDQDGDGLDDAFENSIGTNPALPDTDGDGVTDYAEVGYDGDTSSYTPGQDMNPLSTDTDGDGLLDDVDPVPVIFNYADGDLAPLGAPDGMIDLADLLVATRIYSGLSLPGNLELAHGDVYPAGVPDGVIDMRDVRVIMNLVHP